MKLLKLIKIFDLPIYVLLIQVVLMNQNLYELFPWIDIPMHFIGGFAVAISYIRILNILKKENKFRSIKLVEFAFIISLVSITAVFWEIFEFLIGYYLDLVWQLGYQDTIADLFIGLLGGTFGYLLKK